MNGLEGSQCLRLRANAGADLKLDARGSRDPDGDRLSYKWFVYPEPGTYHGPVTIVGTNTELATMRVPDNASGQTTHVVLTVTDNGQPPLTRYRRVVVTGNKAAQPQEVSKHRP